MSKVLGNRWIVRLKSAQQAEYRLFCLPYAGGGTSVFYNWPDIISSQIEINAIRFPGRESRIHECPFTRLDLLVKNIVKDLPLSYFDRPYAIFGHSLGATIAFELTRRIEEKTGTSPVHLFIAGSRAPHLTNREPPYHHLPDDGFLASIMKYGGLPRQLFENQDFMQMTLPIMRADIEMLETYELADDQELSIPLSAFGGLSDPKVTRSDINGWANYTTNTFRLRLLPEGHFFLNNVQMLQAIETDFFQTLGKDQIKKASVSMDFKIMSDYLGF